MAVAALRNHASETLVTTWLVVAETCRLLGSRHGPEKAIEFVRQCREGSCEIFDLRIGLLPRLEALMHKYRDLPMDLADASLVVLAEELGEGRILSTDERDFRAYRWKNTKPFRNLLAPD